MSKAARFALITIIVHALVSALHGRAHQILNIELSRSQLLFIAIVITCGPLLAGLLIWKVSRRAGALILVVSMAGALIFGVYYHFILVSPDHVSHVQGIPGTTRVLAFQVSAVLLALIEGLGVIAGIMALKSEGAGAA